MWCPHNMTSMFIFTIEGVCAHISSIYKLPVSDSKAKYWRWEAEKAPAAAYNPKPRKSAKAKNGPARLSSMEQSLHGDLTSRELT